MDQVPAGDGGPPVPPPPSFPEPPAPIRRAEMALLRRARRERWGIPDVLKTEAILQCHHVLGHSECERTRVMAARTLAMFDRIDQADERLEFQRRKLALEGNSDPEPEGSIDPAAAERALRALNECGGGDAGECPGDPAGDG
jgi:hypothetical protein